MNNQKPIVTFGEVMLRLVPMRSHDRLVLTDNIHKSFAGAESNVAIALAQLGHPVSFISRLPQNELGNGAINLLREFGVDTSNILRGGDRIGIYFIEFGASIRPSKVIYDRKGSAIQTMDLGLFDWEQILKNKSYLHLSGITPALSENCALETIKAAKTAQELGVQVSFDLNFRRKLWKNRKQASSIFDKILKHTDILFANEGALKDVFEMESSKEDSKDRCYDLMQQIGEKYTFKKIAFTSREHLSASQNKWSGILFDGNQFFNSIEYPIQIVDRLGTGDAFVAGLLFSLSQNWEAQKVIDFAVAASALKHTIPGDLNIVSQKEILSIMEGNISGHIER